MTRFDYTKVRGTAESLIRKFGADSTLTQNALSGPDHNPVLTPTNHACQAALLDYKVGEIDGTEVRRGDSKIYLSTEGLTVTPSPADTITFNAAVYQVIDVKPLEPGGTAVFWELQARR